VSEELAIISNSINNNLVKIERIYSKKRTFAFYLLDRKEEIKEHNIIKEKFVFKLLF